MRGDNEQQAGMFSYISPEQRVPADHPLRPIRKMTDEIFKQLSPRFDQLYSRTGRPSIAPERLLRALLDDTTTRSLCATTLVCSSSFLRLAQSEPANCAVELLRNSFLLPYQIRMNR